MRKCAAEPQPGPSGIAVTSSEGRRVKTCCVIYWTTESWNVFDALLPEVLAIEIVTL
jgi:hypothetical protein